MLLHDWLRSGEAVMSATGRSSRPRLGLVTKGLYGLGALGPAVRLQLLGLVLIYYNQIVGLDAPLVSLAITAALLIDTFWDPIVGQLSDRTHTRLGRRHPYIYAAIVPSAVCFALLFNPPLGWSDEALFFFLLAAVVGHRVFDSMVEIPANAIMPELTQDYDERTSVQSLRFLFGTVAGGLITALLGFGWFLRGTATQRYGQLNGAGYSPYALTVAVVAALAVLVSALATQRFVPHFFQPRQGRPDLKTVAREIGAAASNRNFIALVASAFIFGITIGIAGGLITYLYTYFWELGSKELFWLSLLRIPGGFIGVVLAPWAARTFGKKPACVGVFLASTVAGALPIGLRLLGVLPPNGSPVVLAVLFVDSAVASALGLMGFVIVTSMLADVVEDVQVKSGQRSEGLLFGADSFLRKITSSFTALAPGLILAYVGFPKFAQPGHVDPAILRHLALIFLPITTVLSLLSTSVILFYRIDRTTHADNLKRLQDGMALVEEIDPELETVDAPATAASRPA
jgi:GPH family glycoside/pentoside/hexuronide:cation symporter